MKEEIKNQIKKLKEEKNAVILAHYYVDGEVQEIADYVGDSYFLAKKATEIPAEVIIFCGVSFMGESAKILNPGKTVIMADEHADCPMAHMIDVDRIREVRNLYSDAAVVCYVNSTAEIKAESDVCVTSSNAVKIVERIPNKNIFFIPDNNLGRYVAKQLPDKNFIFHDGFCHVHKSIHKEEVQKAREICREGICGTAESYAVTPKSYGKFLCDFFDLWYEDFIKGEIMDVRMFSNLAQMAAGYLPEECGMNGVCSCYFVVEGDGGVYPCDFYCLDEWKLGTVEDSLHQLLQSEKAIQFIATSRCENENCKKCSYFILCHGGCRRWREPVTDGCGSANQLCEAYEIFFRYTWERIHRLGQYILQRYR